MRSNYKLAVERGARMLDEVAPGWQHQIDIETLDLTNCSLCILGQVRSSLGIGSWQTDSVADPLRSFSPFFGFDCSDDIDYNGSRVRAHRRLARLWLAEIHKRLPNLPRPLLPEVQAEPEAIPSTRDSKDRT